MFGCAGDVRVTRSTMIGAPDLGLDLTGMLDVFLSRVPGYFYKSITTCADHTIWQNVYRLKTRIGDVYLEWIVIDEVLVVSFKVERGQIYFRRRAQAG